jgi:hypothetical protein
MACFESIAPHRHHDPFAPVTGSDPSPPYFEHGIFARIRQRIQPSPERVDEAAECSGVGSEDEYAIAVRGLPGPVSRASRFSIGPTRSIRGPKLTKRRCKWADGLSGST